MLSMGMSFVEDLIISIVISRRGGANQCNPEVSRRRKTGRDLPQYRARCFAFKTLVQQMTVHVQISSEGFWEIPRPNMHNS